MSVTTSTGGSYSCEAMVTPRGSTEFILPSGVGMGTTDVVVQGMMVYSACSFIVRCFLMINSLVPEVSISTEGQSIAGEEYTLVCSVSPADGDPVDDLIDEYVENLTVEWLAPSGSVVESGSGTTQLTHTLNPLLPSHGGEYRCRATLQGGQELLGEDTVNISVSGLSGRDCVEQTNGIHALHCSSTS